MTSVRTLNANLKVIHTYIYKFILRDVIDTNVMCLDEFKHFLKELSIQLYHIIIIILPRKRL